MSLITRGLGTPFLIIRGFELLELEVIETPSVGGNFKRRRKSRITIFDFQLKGIKYSAVELEKEILGKKKNIVERKEALVGTKQLTLDYEILKLLGSKQFFISKDFAINATIKQKLVKLLEAKGIQIQFVKKEVTLQAIVEKHTIVKPIDIKGYLKVTFNKNIEFSGTKNKKLVLKFPVQNKISFKKILLAILNME